MHTKPTVYVALVEVQSMSGHWSVSHYSSVEEAHTSMQLAAIFGTRQRATMVSLNNAKAATNDTFDIPF